MLVFGRSSLDFRWYDEKLTERWRSCCIIYFGLFTYDLTRSFSLTIMSLSLLENTSMQPHSRESYKSKKVTQTRGKCEVAMRAFELVLDYNCRRLENTSLRGLGYMHIYYFPKVPNGIQQILHPKGAMRKNLSLMTRKTRDVAGKTRHPSTFQADDEGLKRNLLRTTGMKDQIILVQEDRHV